MSSLAWGIACALVAIIFWIVGYLIGRDEL